jgi:circadian clock protein KaiC
VPGLDEILGGGWPAGCAYLVEGHPGVGKTTVAMQFLLEGVRRGEKCLYVTLSESKRELALVAESHVWDLGRIDIIEVSVLAQASVATGATLFHPAEIALSQLSKLIESEVERIQPSRVVLDSLSEYRLLAESSMRFRHEILRLKQRLSEMGCTILLLDDRHADVNDGHVHSIVHGVLQLAFAPLRYGIFRRKLCVTKLRGVKFREGNHDFVIGTGGLRVFPRLIAAEHHRPFDDDFASSGNGDLDDLLGGGLHYGTSNLIIGPAGTGKSTLAIQFAHAAAMRGERVNYYLFDETRGTLLKRAAATNLELQPHLASGRLVLEQVDPAQTSPGELAHQIRAAVQNDRTRVVVLDSLNGYVTAMPHEDDLHLHLHELVSFLNQQGVMTVMILAQYGLIGAMGTPIDVSYLADSVIITRFFEALGNVRKAVTIIKKRTGPHEGSLRELSVTANGIAVGPPLTQFQGILTGVPRFLGGDSSRHGDT